MSQPYKFFEEGQIICKQGEKGDSAYIVEEGQVEVFLERDGGKIQPIAQRGPGSIIGEMGIVDDEPRSASVKALSPCKMLEISRGDYMNRLETADPVIQMISKVILTRYRDMLARVEILGDPSAVNAPEDLEHSFADKIDFVESVKIANEFKAALDDEELEMHYQPVVDLAKGTIVGFEALMRWIDKDRGFVSPGVFIPIAEQSGHIVQATKWALKESCKALRRMEQELNCCGTLFMSVNFTSLDFAEPNFVTDTLNTLKECDVKPEQLKIEITERLLINQPDQAKRTLQACRNAGINIAIDDFGTGYSSLSYLYYYPINVLKIDQSFIRVMYQEEKTLELVKSIIALGKNMDLKIIAEGVENREEAELLQDLACDSCQGYFFAKPMREADAIETVKNWVIFKRDAA